MEIGNSTVRRVKQVRSIRLKQKSSELVFRGSILIEILQENILVWSVFYHTKLIRNQFLKAQGFILIQFSQKFNWFISVNDDQSVQSWKQLRNGHWLGTSKIKKHTNQISCLFLNKNEDQFLTGSSGGIMVWKVNSQENLIEFYYIIDFKNLSILSISSNQSETQLVLSTFTKIIILLSKGSNGRWQYLNQLKHHTSFSNIFYFSDNQIACKKQTYMINDIFLIQNWKIIEKPEEKLLLSEGLNRIHTVPAFYNKQKEILVQTCDNNTYFLKLEANGKLQIVFQFQLTQEVILKAAMMQNGQFLTLESQTTHKSGGFFNQYFFREISIIKISYG